MESENVISPERAVQLLKKDGIEVTLEQAKLVVSFLSVIADIVVEQYLNE